MFDNGQLHREDTNDFRDGLKLSSRDGHILEKYLDGRQEFITIKLQVYVYILLSGIELSIVFGEV